MLPEFFFESEPRSGEINSTGLSPVKKVIYVEGALKGRNLFQNPMHSYLIPHQFI